MAEVGRTVETIRLPDWGRVVRGSGVVPYELVDPDGNPVTPVQRFLREMAARGAAAGSVRSYAYGLQRWWRFLRAVNVDWNQASPTEACDFVLWMAQATKPVAQRRTISADTAGRINPVTRKEHAGNVYKPRTIRHNNAVVRSFYEFYGELGEGPVVNPIVRERGRGARANAHHNPMQSFVPEGRLRYNPKPPKARPRSIPDDRWVELFAAMRSNRDRAILALAVSSAARAGELLGMRVADVDWGDQLVQVRRKGTGACQWLPASSEAFVWLRLWLTELGEPEPDDPVWQTLRRRGSGDQYGREELTYDALRAVLRRANAALGSNWTMHDLRHTCALRMLRSKKLSLRDVQTILGHANITTTQIYLVADDVEVLERAHEHLVELEQAPPRPPRHAVGYNDADLAVLFGGALR